MCLRDLLRQLFQAFAAACDEDEAVATLGQLARDGRADPGGGTGDEGSCVGARGGQAQCMGSRGEGMQKIRTFFPPNGGKSITQLYLLPAACVRSNA